MSEDASPRLYPAALLAFLLGLSSPLLSLATALPAIYFGIQAIRAINRSEGRLRGQRLAIAGLVLSGVVTLVTIFGTAVLLVFLVQGKSQVAGCSNNLRQIGTALQSYSDDNDKTFPPGTIPNPALKPEQRLSWEAAILPWLAEGGPARKKGDKLAGKIQYKEAWNAPANAALQQNIGVYSCPVFVLQRTPEQVGLTSYVGIAGVGDDAAMLPLDHANAGVFGYDRLLHPSEISASLAATMVAIETGQEMGPWAAGGPATVRGVAADGTRYVGMGAAFGGFHREGANVLWGDGSVRIVIEQVDPQRFRLDALINRE